MTQSDQPPGPTRLREISRTLPSNSVPLPKGYGYKAWETKRVNAFRRACAQLRAGDASLADLRRAAAIASDYIAAWVPPEINTLARSYLITKNAGGERTLSRGAVSFGPWYSDPEPDKAALAQFGADLRTGFLCEIEKLTGAGLK